MSQAKKNQSICGAGLDYGIQIVEEERLGQIFLDKTVQLMNNCYWVLVFPSLEFL